MLQFSTYLRLFLTEIQKKNKRTFQIFQNQRLQLCINTKRDFYVLQPSPDDLEETLRVDVTDAIYGGSYLGQGAYVFACLKLTSPICGATPIPLDVNLSKLVIGTIGWDNRVAFSEQPKPI
jgi:hypothetical protein